MGYSLKGERGVSRGDGIRSKDCRCFLRWLCFAFLSVGVPDKNMNIRNFTRVWPRKNEKIIFKNRRTVMDLYSTERATTTHASRKRVDPNDYWFSRYTSDRIPAIFTPSTTRFRCCLIIGYIASFAPSASPTEVPYYWPLGTWLSTGYFSFSYNAIPMFAYPFQTHNVLHPYGTSYGSSLLSITSHLIRIPAIFTLSTT